MSSEILEDSVPADLGLDMVEVEGLHPPCVDWAVVGAVASVVAGTLVTILVT